MVTTEMATTGVPRNGGMHTRAAVWGSAIRAACTGTAGAGSLRRRAAMSVASRRAAAILSTAIAIIVIMMAAMTIAATMTDAMTAVACPIRRATPVSIVNP